MQEDIEDIWKEEGKLCLLDDWSANIHDLLPQLIQTQFPLWVQYTSELIDFGFSHETYFGQLKWQWESQQNPSIDFKKRTFLWIPL